MRAEFYQYIIGLYTALYEKKLSNIVDWQRVNSSLPSYTAARANILCVSD